MITDMFHVAIMEPEGLRRLATVGIARSSAVRALDCVDFVATIYSTIYIY